MKILIIDKDRKLYNTLRRKLDEARYELQYAAKGEEGLKAAQEKQFDLILLDWAVGLSVLKELREQKISTPILMLTAEDAIRDVVASLDSGADACVMKPFEIRVLIARMNALVRRRKWDRGAEIGFANIRLDPVTHKVWRDNNEVSLTAKEYALLLYFMQNPDQVVTRTMIAEEVWGNEFDTFTNIIDVYVNYLRKKIDYGASANLIHTVRGAGYIFKTVEP